MSGLGADVKEYYALEYANLCDAGRFAVMTTGAWLQDVYRGQVASAGLGAGLEKAWRLKIYPRLNKQTLHPAAFVYSKAQKLHEAYNTGGIIHTKNGARYLAIPTDNVPRNFATRKKMSPVEVEAQFNKDLVFVPHKAGRPGGVLVLPGVVRAKSGKGLRQASRGRLQQGRSTENVVMFTLIPSAKLTKRLDLDGPAREAEEKLYSLYLGAINERKS